MQDVPTELLSKYINEILEENRVEKQALEDQGDEEGNNGQINSSCEVRSRGRPRIPLRWTRMISINGDDLTKVRCFDLATDLLLDNAMDKAPMRRRGEIEWQPLFWPKQFVQQGHDHTLEGNKLSEAKLRALGKKITKMRTNLRETAAALPVIPEYENEGLDQM